MTTPMQVTPLAIEDYDAIESAVMETTRGRWFLTEYARRNRNADTDQILTGLERIERTLRRERAAPDIDRIRLDLADMAEAISRTKQEIAQMKVETEHGGRFADASFELDAIVSQTETATNEILLAAEGIQEVAWTLREAGATDELCDRLDAHSTEIYTACSFQDLTGQRTRKVVTVLRYLESRINTMMSIWGLEEAFDEHLPADGTDAGHPMDTRPDAHLLNGPQLHGHGIEQNAVDDLMWDSNGTPEVEEEPATEVACVEESQAEEIPAVALDPVAEEPAADVFAAPEPAATGLDDPFDLAAADVFAGEDLERVAARASEPIDAPMVGTPTTITVGNTIMTAEAVAYAETAEPAVTLAVVAAEDPLEMIGPKARIVTFG